MQNEKNRKPTANWSPLNPALRALPICKRWPSWPSGRKRSLCTRMDSMVKIITATSTVPVWRSCSNAMIWPMRVIGRCDPPPMPSSSRMANVLYRYSNCSSIKKSWQSQSPTQQHNNNAQYTQKTNTNTLEETHANTTNRRNLLTHTHEVTHAHTRELSSYYRHWRYKFHSSWSAKSSINITKKESTFRLAEDYIPLQLCLLILFLCKL